MLRKLGLWTWAKACQTIWRTDASRDQLDQVIWRLEMNQSTPDNRAALNLAKQLRKRVYG